jgi:hypothetical protein
MLPVQLLVLLAMKFGVGLEAAKAQLQFKANPEATTPASLVCFIVTEPPVEVIFGGRTDPVKGLPVT